jgi:hypothetical protein
MNKVEKNKIYFVNVFMVPQHLLDQEPKKEDKLRDWDCTMYRRHRCWGWFMDVNEAKKVIENNVGDIYECGYYNLAMIESSEEGFSFLGTKPLQWYKVDYNPNSQSGEFDYTVAEIDPPKRFDRVVGFSCG